MKKIFSLLLVAVLLVSSIPCFADSITEAGIDFKPTIESASTVTGLAAAKEPATTLFSFASDTYHNGPTFKGNGGTNTFTSDALVNLLVDVNNDLPGGIVSFMANLRLKAEAYDYRVYNIGPQYLHVWKVYSEMTFTHFDPRTNNPILGIGFKEGVLTSWSPSPYTLGETMTLQDSQSADQSIYMDAYPLLNGIGVPKEYLYTSKDLAFTFTNVRAISNNGNPNNLVNLDKEGIFKDDWKSEGSFSASASEK
jgi:hypothetical protein